MTTDYRIQWGDDNYATNIIDTTGNGHLVATVPHGYCDEKKREHETRMLAYSRTMYTKLKKLAETDEEAKEIINLIDL